MELTTFKELEQILLYAIKMPTIKIKDIAAATGIGLSGLYKFSRGENGISPENADRLLIYLRDNRPDLLIAAETLFKQGGLIDV